MPSHFRARFSTNTGGLRPHFSGMKLERRAYLFIARAYRPVYCNYYGNLAQRIASMVETPGCNHCHDACVVHASWYVSGVSRSCLLPWYLEDPCAAVFRRPRVITSGVSDLCQGSLSIRTTCPLLLVVPDNAFASDTVSPWSFSP